MGVVYLARRLILATLHLHTHLTISVAERHTAERQAINILDRKQIVVLAIRNDVAVDTNVLQHKVAHIEARADLGRCREDNILQQLQIAMITQRQISRQQRNLVRYSLQAVALTAHNLEHVGILLVGHNARSGGQFIGEAHETEVLAHKQTNVHRHLTQRRSQSRNGVSCRALGLTTAHLCRHNIIVQRLEAQQFGGHTAIQRERRAITRSRSERILICDFVCRSDHLHIIDQRLGISAKPQTKRRRHCHLQMGVTRHQHVSILVAQLLQALKQSFGMLSHHSQLVTHKEFQIDQHLIVTRATRVNLFAHIAQLAGQHQLNLRVNILDTLLDHKFTALGRCVNLCQRFKQHIQLLFFEQTDALQHTNMRHRALDIIFSQSQIQFTIATYGKLLDQFIGLEALAPKFHILYRFFQFLYQFAIQHNTLLDLAFENILVCRM